MQRQDNLYNTVKFLTEISPTRSFFCHESLNIAADYINSKFEEYDLSTAFQEYSVGGKVYKNVIATLNPHKEKYIILGAHYDAVFTTKGADDNASSVATLLECARALSLLKDSLDAKIDFIAFTLEEPPNFTTEHMGSKVHAKYLKDNNIKLDLMINLEMVGYYSNELNSQHYPFDYMSSVYPNTGDFIAAVSNERASAELSVFNTILQKHIKTISLALPDVILDITRSDNLSYQALGYKAIMLTDTADFRNPNYHKPTDTIDTLNFEMMSKLCKGLIEAILVFAKV